MLSTRKEVILRVVVGEYVATAAPVSSATVAGKYTSHMSPATVRNEMAELEEQGYITRPHTSAGRIPLDKAYRYYVEFLTEADHLPLDIRAKVRQRFSSVDLNMEAWTQVTAQLLANFVQNMVIVTFPRALSPRIHHIEVVYLQDLLGLLLLVFQQTRVRKEVVLFKDPVSREELSRTSGKLQGLYSGLTRQEVKARPEELSPLERQMRTRVMELMAQEELEQSTHHVVEGLQHLLGQPEFSARVDPSGVARLVEDQRLVKAIVTELPEPREVRVLIGTENVDEGLKPFSLVLGQYGIAGEAQGAVGILGPTRLHYSRAIAGVRYFSKLMSELVESVQGRVL